MADTKNWTWVLERQCPECGFDAATLERSDIRAATRSVAERYLAFLVADDHEVRARPEPEVWSPLEYGCHVRDVFTVMSERLRRMLDEDGPAFANWDQDAAAVDEHYERQDPVVVSSELMANGAAIADLFAAVSGDTWLRPGYRSDGAAFTVESLGRYMVHDIVHHVWDLERVPPVGSGHEDA
jgi:hypothetical protein